MKKLLIGLFLAGGIFAQEPQDKPKEVVPEVVTREEMNLLLDRLDGAFMIIQGFFDDYDNAIEALQKKVKELEERVKELEAKQIKIQEQGREHNLDAYGKEANK